MRVAPEDVDGQVAATESPELKVIIRFAVETAMRRSEIVCIRWEHFNLQRRSVYLPETKTDQPWTVPLSTGPRVAGWHEASRCRDGILSRP